MEINLEMPNSVPDDDDNDNDDHVLDTNRGNMIIENLNDPGGEEINGGRLEEENEPRNGLEFETKETAYSFYREYARSLGFGITIKASRRSKKSGHFIDVKIVCSRFGTKQSNAAAAARSFPRTDCKAGMHMKRRDDGKWYIYRVEKEHNHDICPHDFELSIKGGGRYNYKQQQVAGLVVPQKKGLQLALPTEEDVNLLLDFLSIMQAQSPNFYYALDFNSKNGKRMQNVFWIDPKGRSDYEHFFDVVFFDTSYLRRGFSIPFLPVVGVNHHFQYILLGGALVGDETSLSFAWLMRTWLRVMGGRSPTVVHLKKQ